jgi:hypothetical protein
MKTIFERLLNPISYLFSYFWCSYNEFLKNCGIIHFSKSLFILHWISLTLLVAISMNCNFEN